MSTETELRNLMERALDDVTAPAGLRDAAVTAGERLRRRRRTGSALAGLAAAAAVAAIAVPLAGGSASTATDAPPASSTEPSPSAVVNPEPEPAPFVAHPGWWDMPVLAMRNRLADLLPEGVTISDFERRNTDHGPGESDVYRGVLRATLTVDGSPGSLEMFLYELPQDEAALSDELHRALSCDRSLWLFDEPDAQWTCDDSMSDQRSVEHTDRGVTSRSVHRRVGDGMVYVAVANSTSYKWGPPASAEEPPLSLADLERIAASDAWTDWSARAR